MYKTLKILAVAGLGLFSQVAASHAVVVTQPFVVTFGTQAGPFSPYLEDGMSVTPTQLVNGNCLSTSCLALNGQKKKTPDDSSTLSRVGGGEFSVTSFWLQALGQPSQLTVKAYLQNVLVSTLAFTALHNVGTTVNYTFAGAYDSLSFIDTGQGNIRIDSINGSTQVISAVPLPAGLPLLLSGLAGIGLLRRRRNKASAA